MFVVIVAVIIRMVVGVMVGAIDDHRFWVHVLLM